MSDLPEWPNALRAALKSPALERRGWEWSLAPQLIGLFLWVAFFDQIPQETLTPGGIAWPVLGAAVAGWLCYFGLYRSTALWGMSTGRPLGVVATSTFGVNGATWVPGLLLSGAAVVWLAVSTLYATVLSLRGLVLIQMLDPRYLNPGGGRAPGILFLVTSLFWCYAAALVGRYLVRVIAALMNVFTILPGVMLGLTTVLALPGLRGYHAAQAFRPDWPVGVPTGIFSAALTAQMIFGFFATSGLLAVDWGNVARSSTDVKAAGWVGVALGSWIVATLAILTVAGASAKDLVTGPSLRYASALESLVGGRTAGLMLMTFGLAALAVACYASFVFSTRLNETWPRVARTRWTILGAGIAWILVSTGLVERLFDVFSLVGGLAAPAVGAIAADHVRSRGVWPGPRTGYNRAGLIAWVFGVGFGLAPMIGRIAGLSRAWPWLASMQPAAVIGFFVAFCTYLIAAKLGAESAIDDRLKEHLGADVPAEPLA